MAQVYALLILEGKKELDDVPERLKEQVKAILKENDYPLD